MAEYVFDQAWEQEKQRLDVQASLYEEGTRHLLATLGICPGAVVAEVGAGSGITAEWMAEQVGDDGHVLAVDLDPRFIVALESPRFEVRVQNIVQQPLDPGRFDLVHARLVVMHLGDGRKAALENMIAGLKPGGALLIEDYDTSTTALRYPDRPSMGKAMHALDQLLIGAGADPYYGRRLASELEDAGLLGVEASARTTPMKSGSPGMATFTLIIEATRALIVQMGLMTDDEVDQALADATEPGGWGFPPLMVSAWGRTPA